MKRDFLKHLGFHSQTRLSMNSFKVGDKVTRKNINAFRYMQGIVGEIVEKTPDGRNKIKWEVIASNGQQHSTIQDKFLNKVTTS